MYGVLGRVIFLVIASALGYLVAFISWGYESNVMLGFGLGFLIGVAVLLLERGFRKVSAKSVFSGVLGLIIGLIIARVLIDSLSSLLASLTPPWSLAFRLTLVLVFTYLGVVITWSKGRDFNLVNFVRIFKEQPRAESYKILDTSVIIDGRIADICETGFLEGTLLIPQFVLRELQHIADSPDPLKRNRGRRGLDILQRIQKKIDAHVEVSDMDFPEMREVDAKLVAMAKVLNAKVITNDFNLNKVAELHGVQVLNINELTNALKPVVLPGEEIRVYVLKEGKEYNQGVAYLDDGTMVVIDSGRRFIGQTIDVTVTSVLQTTAGRMIFSRLKEEAEAA